MIKTRSKVVEFSDNKFQVKKLQPDTGSFIFMRMLGISMRMSAEAPVVKASTEQPETPVPEPSGEMRVRALAFGVFSGAIGVEDFKFIQNSCMRSVSIVKEREGVEFPLPVMNDNGEWTPDGMVVADDFKLLMNLTTEVLVLCFSDFFEGSSLGT